MQRRRDRHPSESQVDAYDGSAGPNTPPNQFGETMVLPVGTYRVVDGDTIAVNSNKPGQAAVRIRLRSIEAPELPKMTALERSMQREGIRTFFGHGGMMAKEVMETLVRDRPLMVAPRGVDDRYGRLIADVYISGPPPSPLAPKNAFYEFGATSLEHELIKARAVSWNMSQRPPQEHVDNGVKGARLGEDSFDRFAGF